MAILAIGVRNFAKMVKVNVLPILHGVATAAGRIIMRSSGGIVAMTVGAGREIVVDILYNILPIFYAVTRFAVNLWIVVS